MVAGWFGTGEGAWRMPADQEALKELKGAGNLLPTGQGSPRSTPKAEPHPNRAGENGAGSTNAFRPVTISAIILPVTAASVSP